MAGFFSAASALLTGKSGPLPNFVIGEREVWFDNRSIWSLHSATRRDDSLSCSVLVFDAMLPTHNPRRSQLPLAKNGLRRLRTTRHPDVIRLLDSAETPTAVYIAVEAIRPLGKVLTEMRGTTQQRDEWVEWGLAKVTNALRFLHVDMGVTHGNVRTDSIFLATSGEWRLGGLELVSKPQEEETGQAVLYRLGGMVPDAARYAPPEVKQQGWGVLKDLDIHTCDAYAFALVILEVFNGALPPPSSSDVAVTGQGRVPGPLYGMIKRMMLPNAKSRLTVSALAEAGQALPGGFFAENRLYKVASGLDGFVLASEQERSSLLRTLKSTADSFPPDFLRYKVLPALVDAIVFGGGSAAGQSAGVPSSANHAVQAPAIATSSHGSSSLHASRLLPLILQLSRGLTDQEWGRSVKPTIFKAFGSPDRLVRMTLLDNLSSYVDRFDGKQISERIWPHFLTGFVDASAAIREATVRAVMPLAPKLSERILNNDLLRQLARSQVDTEPRIRTNTTILLGNLASKLALPTRKKVLVPAFVRSLKDPFVHARIAGLTAFMATGESFDGEDCARHIVPAMCPCLLDVDKGVRDQAKEAVQVFLSKVDHSAQSMPDTPRQADDDAVLKGTSSLDPHSTSTDPTDGPPSDRGLQSVIGNESFLQDHPAGRQEASSPSPPSFESRPRFASSRHAAIGSVHSAVHRQTLAMKEPIVADDEEDAWNDMADTLTQDRSSFGGDPVSHGEVQEASLSQQDLLASLPDDQAKLEPPMGFSSTLRDERRALMEKQRAARRARMASLKESKAAKLAADLS